MEVSLSHSERGGRGSIYYLKSEKLTCNERPRKLHKKKTWKREVTRTRQQGARGTKIFKELHYSFVFKVTGNRLPKINK